VTTVVGPSSFNIDGLLSSATVGTLADVSGPPLRIIGVTSDGATGTTMLITASGTATLTAGFAIPSANARAMALTQLDGGRGDVLIAEGGALGFCQSKDPQTAGCAPNIAVSAQLSSVSVIDFTGDGRLDVVAGNADAMHFFASTPMAPDLGSTPAVLTELAPSYLLNGAISAVVADFNGDGNVDVAYIESSASSVHVAYLGKNRLEIAHDTLSLGPMLNILLVANLNSDGKPDLVAVSSDGAVWSLVHAP